ncbi:universal stress protein [Natrarchaeobius chitinivorans]|uniref:Universal stress protein n=1 Tax=Natrarchaeobius chitinivorans TaxID=1679083 RepID=A0A3N6MPJ2_NATCH|nr:universal stress protein [Natrarchaeobius chitinivorans]RQG96436.1 universal stress protein [Natrarchaeobius chitinivorans]
MKLLVAVDGSDEAENALEYAVNIATAVDGSITVVHAIDPVVYEEGGSEPISTLSDADQRLILEALEDTEQRGIEILEAAIAHGDELGYDVDSELLYGDPVTEIPDYADAEGFDAIYVGHRGRSERLESILGSVAKTLVERSNVPVTVVR